MSRRFVIDKESLPDLAGMMLVTVEALKAMGGSASIEELDEKAIELEGLSEAEQTYVMANNDTRTRVNYYLSWARTYLRRGGALDNSSRGVWSLTESGARITSYAEVKAIYDQVTQEERERARLKRLAAKQTPKPQDAIEQPQDGDEPAGEEDWKASLLTVLGNMSPGGFERLSQRLLREAGFTKVEVRGKSGDGGVDGVGVLRVNLVSFQVYFQCKKWKAASAQRRFAISAGPCRAEPIKGFLSQRDISPVRRPTRQRVMGQWPST